MSEQYIIIGTNNGYVASHASSIDTLVRLYKDGRTQSEEYTSTSGTPGQELLHYIDSNHPQAEAVITKEFQGPKGYSRRGIINVEDNSVEEVVENYSNGKYDEDIASSTKKKSDVLYGVPKENGSSRGQRGNRDKNPDFESGEG